ncbi:MAG: S41 family peptidase [Treponema sp.]
MIKMKLSSEKFMKFFSVAFALFFLTIGASQCFAKSSSETADTEKAKSRQYIEIINSVFDYIQRNYVDEVDAEKLYEGAMKGMLDSMGDPHTVYLSAQDWNSLNDTTTGNFGGVGLSISKASESTPEKPAYVEVASPIEDSPGAKAGIVSGDLIIAIEDKDTSTMTMDEVLGMLRGTVGESVTITVRRGKNMEFKKTLVRAIIEVPTVKYGMIGKIGYLRIIEFTPNTADRVQDAIDSFKKNNFTSLIIDLRNNPGGLITSVSDVADKFIDEGPIVTTKSRIDYENSVFMASAKKTTMPKGIPIIVMINRGSASASEILSGALKDDHLAYLVGERSYGKGSVQQPIPLPNNDGFKMTIARYYTPSDTNIDKIGIPPDREIKYPDFTEAEEKTYLDLMNSGEVEKYVDANKPMTEKSISFYAVELQKKYNLELRILRKIIRNEVERTIPTPLYDLDYDLQLKETLSILKNENFNELMKTTKTLKELQEAAALEEKTEAAEDKSNLE